MPWFVYLKNVLFTYIFLLMITNTDVGSQGTQVLVVKACTNSGCSSSLCMDTSSMDTLEVNDSLFERASYFTTSLYTAPTISKNTPSEIKSCHLLIRIHSRPLRTMIFGDCRGNCVSFIHSTSNFCVYCSYQNYQGSFKKYYLL